MSWVLEGFGLYGHEGTMAALLEDGSEIPYAEAGPREATRVRAVCSCGWRDVEDHPAVPGDLRATEGRGSDDTPHAAWEAHAAGVLLESLSELDEAVRTVDWYLDRLADSRPMVTLAAASRLEAMIQRVLPRAAARARMQDATWEDIGRVMGRSRQAAHQRLRKYTA
ncbi:hypothetical protein RM780_05675 [Streptomyces sp. DSM 44917]|uniref:Uncharacterized protein n=1 Tax=Streptomyces boetiae TaxID=3075541 RepID=A0ABU2L4G1_9ACTN|nr:hypothetical protein [Streptomyces sp. DSM 44917]MDT0306449.1 hypothetical protein [Streptomyces sp. DSM 44917]